MANVIETCGLTKRYGQLTAVDGVNLSVGEGELFGLIGPDGAGKSSIYRMLATLMPPDGGTARVLGLDVAADYRRIRTLIGYMPERFSLYPDLTVSENLKFFASLFKVSVERNRDLIDSIFSQLARFPDRPAGKLSGGMKQKLALSCALIHRPRLLLLDEPTTGVDAVSRSEFWQMLRSLARKGMTIMVSTSYMDEAALCDRVAMISKGRIMLTDTPKNICKLASSNLYEARSRNIFLLLGALRSLPGVDDCYTFGASLHFKTSPGFSISDAMRSLREAGIGDVEIAPARGDVEDLFINLSQDDDRNGR